MEGAIGDFGEFELDGLGISWFNEWIEVFRLRWCGTSMVVVERFC